MTQKHSIKVPRPIATAMQSVTECAHSSDPEGLNSKQNSTRGPRQSIYFLHHGTWRHIDSLIVLLASNDWPSPRINIPQSSSALDGHLPDFWPSGRTSRSLITSDQSLPFTHLPMQPDAMLLVRRRPEWRPARKKERENQSRKSLHEVGVSALAIAVARCFGPGTVRSRT